MKLIPVNSTNLKEDQRLLVEDITKFFESKKLSYTISGFAGTGKSFVVKYIIDNLLSGNKVAVTAPTHKAVRVIEKFTGKSGHTLHSLHGLRPNFSLDEFSIDSFTFESIGNVKFDQYEVIFIDEASMINEDLKKLNDIRSKDYDTRIVYMGDPYQLPPVKEHEPSKIFTKVDNYYNLTEVIRQDKSNPLLELFDMLREDIGNDTANFINHIKKHRQAVVTGGYIVLSGKDFFLKAVDHFLSEEFKKNVNYCRIGTYTNDSIAEWNKAIRSRIFPNAPLIVKDDVLTAYKTIVDDNNATVITNSTDYRVMDVIWRLNDDGFYSYHLKVLDLDVNKMIFISIADHTNPTFKVYYDKLNKLHRLAYHAGKHERAVKYKEYFKYKDKYLCMVDFTLKDAGSHYDRGWVKKEIDYGYAISIHKSQGSTFENIFIDARNICYMKSNANLPRINSQNNPYAISLRNRLLYTGLSRASNIVYIFI